MFSFVGYTHTHTHAQLSSYRHNQATVLRFDVLSNLFGFSLWIDKFGEQRTSNHNILIIVINFQCQTSIVPPLCIARFLLQLPLPCRIVWLEFVLFLVFGVNIGFSCLRNLRQHHSVTMPHSHDFKLTWTNTSMYEQVLNWCLANSQFQNENATIVTVHSFEVEK